MAKAEVAEYRGCENLVYAKITKDDSESYTTGEVKELAGLAEVGVTVEQSSETKYYDNNPALVLKGQGAETRTFTIDHLPLALLAELTGQDVDEGTGALLGGGDVKNPYFAVGYITEVTSGIKTYKWTLKGTFAIPDETNTTKNGGTDSNNLSLVYTGIATTHKFSNGGKKTYVALEDVQPDGSTIDLSTWFDKVQTPDTLSTFKKVQPSV
jgi:phi13 family phage major tail protein